MQILGTVAFGLMTAINLAVLSMSSQSSSGEFVSIAERAHTACHGSPMEEGLHSWSHFSTRTDG